MIYKANTQRLWEQLAYCDCKKPDCSPKNHRLCPRCNEKILYGSHQSIESLNKSQYAWNVDLIIAKAQGGTNKISNLQACHLKCNRSRNKKDWSGEY